MTPSCRGFLAYTNLLLSAFSQSAGVPLDVQNDVPGAAVRGTGDGRDDDDDDDDVRALLASCCCPCFPAASPANRASLLASLCSFISSSVDLRSVLLRGGFCAAECRGCIVKFGSR